MNKKILHQIDLFYRQAGGQKEWEQHLANKVKNESITLTRETSQTELTAWARQNPRLAEELRRMMNEILGERVPQNYGELKGDLNQASEKPVPHWARSAVQNYKEQFKAAHGRDTKLSDHQVFICFNNRAEYATSEETDEGVVDDMFDKERALGHHPDPDPDYDDWGPTQEEIDNFESDPADLSDEERNEKNQKILEKNWQGK